MTLITSPHNPRLKELRKLHRASERARSGLFFVEGEDLVEAALHAGWPAVEGFRVAGCNAGEGGFHEVQPAALAAVSTLGSGTRAIGVYAQRWQTPVGPLCVYLHGVGDPGNVGTILRGALAFGASCMALGPGCADPYSPKAVRASMGAIFSVAIARVGNVAELPGERVALVARAGEPLWRTAEGIRMAASGRPESSHAGDRANSAEQRANGGEHARTLLIGAERDGLPPDVLDVCERIAHIPIASESLNAAMAATVALYETTRPSTRVSAS